MFLQLCDLAPVADSFWVPSGGLRLQKAGAELTELVGSGEHHQGLRLGVPCVPGGFLARISSKNPRRQESPGHEYRSADTRNTLMHTTYLGIYIYIKHPGPQLPTDMHQIVSHTHRPPGELKACPQLQVHTGTHTTGWHRHVPNTDTQTCTGLKALSPTHTHTHTGSSTH